MDTTCVCCNKLVLTEKCPECEFDFCQPCKKKELHTGTFTCIVCQKTRCNTYIRHQREKGIECWFCDVSQNTRLLSNFVKSFPNNPLTEIIHSTVDELTNI